VATCREPDVIFCVGHGGIGDVEKHVRTAKHVAKAGCSASSGRPIQHFFTNRNDLSVIRAETLFTEFLVEHNLPLACSDHTGKLLLLLLISNNCCKRVKLADSISLAARKAHLAVIPRVPF